MSLSVAGPDRAIRGGSWDSLARYEHESFRSANRSSVWGAILGLRLLRRTP